MRQLGLPQKQQNTGKVEFSFRESSKVPMALSHGKEPPRALQSLGQGSRAHSSRLGRILCMPDSGPVNQLESINQREIQMHLGTHTRIHNYATGRHSGSKLTIRVERTELGPSLPQPCGGEGAGSGQVQVRLCTQKVYGCIE